MTAGLDLRVAAYGVVVDGDRMLLAHWNEAGRRAWTLPGGGIDPGEDPLDEVDGLDRVSQVDAGRRFAGLG